MDYAGQSVLVMGLGLSGQSAASFLAERGAQVVAADEREAHGIDGLDRLPANVETRLGRPFEGLADYDLVVPSPGIPRARWAPEASRAWGDIELCYRALSIPIIAVTGTNGKSTVVRLIETLARAAGLRARAAGNLGVPALDLVGEALDVAILEVSSFQLESVDRFRPRTGVLLNISPDHLDRHGDLEGYRDAKARLFANQGAGDAAIVNGDDALCASLDLPESVERLEFRREGPVAAGAFLDGTLATITRQGQTNRIPLDSATGLRQQSDNVLAALLALATLEVDLERAGQGLSVYEPLPHRYALVAEIDGVRFIDDSKATNVGAACRSLEKSSGPVLWIAGGRHKGGDLGPLREAAVGCVRRAFLIGEAAPAIAEVLDGVPHELVGDLSAAVEAARGLAKPGDLVLLSPACASFDQFQSFEERGRAFETAVRREARP